MLWSGWERVKTSTSHPAVKKTNQRGGPAMVCHVEHPSVLLSIEKKLLAHTWGCRQHTQGKGELSSSFLHLFPHENHVGRERKFCFAKLISEGHLFNRNRAGWLRLSKLLYTHLTPAAVKLSLKHNLVLTRRALHRNESLWFIKPWGFSAEMLPKVTACSGCQSRGLKNWLVTGYC